MILEYLNRSLTRICQTFWKEGVMHFLRHLAELIEITFSKPVIGSHFLISFYIPKRKHGFSNLFVPPMRLPVSVLISCQCETELPESSWYFTLFALLLEKCSQVTVVNMFVIIFDKATLFKGSDLAITAFHSGLSSRSTQRWCSIFMSHDSFYGEVRVVYNLCFLGCTSESEQWPHFAEP